MQGSDFDEFGFFAAIGASGARALLIGRRALVLLGLPVLTAHYDLWAHPDDVELLNRAVDPWLTRLALVRAPLRGCPSPVGRSRR